VSGKWQLTIIVIHDDVKVDSEHAEMHIVSQWCHITAEGPPDFFFTMQVAADNPIKEPPAQDVPLLAAVFKFVQHGVMQMT